MKKSKLLVLPFMALLLAACDSVPSSPVSSSSVSGSGSSSSVTSSVLAPSSITSSKVPISSSHFGSSTVITPSTSTTPVPISSTTVPKPSFSRDDYGYVFGSWQGMRGTHLDIGVDSAEFIDADSVVYELIPVDVYDDIIDVTVNGEPTILPAKVVSYQELEHDLLINVTLLESDQSYLYFDLFNDAAGEFANYDNMFVDTAAFNGVWSQYPDDYNVIGMACEDKFDADVGAFVAQNVASYFRTDFYYAPYYNFDENHEARLEIDIVDENFDSYYNDLYLEIGENNSFTLQSEDLFDIFYPSYGSFRNDGYFDGEAYHSVSTAKDSNTGAITLSIDKEAPVDVHFVLDDNGLYLEGTVDGSRITYQFLNNSTIEIIANNTVSYFVVVNAAGFVGEYSHANDIFAIASEDGVNISSVTHNGESVEFNFGLDVRDTIVKVTEGSKETVIKVFRDNLAVDIFSGSASTRYFETGIISEFFAGSYSTVDSRGVQEIAIGENDKLAISGTSYDLEVAWDGFFYLTTDAFEGAAISLVGEGILSIQPQGEEYPTIYISDTILARFTGSFTNGKQTIFEYDGKTGLSLYGTRPTFMLDYISGVGVLLLSFEVSSTTISNYHAITVDSSGTVYIYNVSDEGYLDEYAEESGIRHEDYNKIAGEYSYVNNNGVLEHFILEADGTFTMSTSTGSGNEVADVEYTYHLSYFYNQVCLMFFVPSSPGSDQGITLGLYIGLNGIKAEMFSGEITYYSSDLNASQGFYISSGEGTPSSVYIYQNTVSIDGGSKIEIVGKAIDENGNSVFTLQNGNTITITADGAVTSDVTYVKDIDFEISDYFGTYTTAEDASESHTVVFGIHEVDGMSSVKVKVVGLVIDGGTTVNQNFTISLDDEGNVKIICEDLFTTITLQIINGVKVLTYSSNIPLPPPPPPPPPPPAL